MLALLLILAGIAPLIAAALRPDLLAPAPAWPAALTMVALAVGTVAGMVGWTRSGTGAAVRDALGWRYALLLVALVAPFATMGALFLFDGPVIGATGNALLVAMLGLLQFAGGLAAATAPRNRLLGFRTPRTLASDAAWHAANRRWGLALAWGAPLALFGLAAGPYGPLVALLPVFGIAAAFLSADRR